MDDSILIDELESGAGFVVGHLQLNAESTLNSLSLAMVRQIRPQLDAWRERSDVSAVVITAVGEKAFCAGGDIQALYRGVSANHEVRAEVDSYPFDFFREEYELDYAIHTYPKPVLTIGQGIVMGGGLGIFSASSHRVATETSRMALPEITIGLFPDAGATWTLGRMQQHWASFLGMTGSHINATDALKSGIATHVIAQEQRLRLISELTQLPWVEDAAANHALLDDWLSRGSNPPMPESALVNVVDRDVYFDDFEKEVAQLNALKGASDWIDRGLGNLRGGCPTTAGIVVEQLRRVASLSLADSFRLELTVATHCARYSDFREGVRALLIDKDGAPQWKFGSLAGLEWSHVLSHFEDPWDEHPLAHLEEI
jgi:enoyl-CoA hydratase/carnithine racemase